MGGRGGKSGILSKGSADGTIISNETRTIETIYIEGRGFVRGRYKNEVLEATTDGFGNLTFNYATADSYEKSAKTNKTNYVTYTLKAGAVDGQTFNIDWNKVNSVSGNTYSLRKEAKEAGLSWDEKEKKWKRKK